MSNLKLLVLSRPGLPHLSHLGQLEGVTIAVTDDPASVATEATDAHAVLNCTGQGALLRAALLNGKQVRWVHSLAAGVENQLISELMESDIPFTNSRGVYKESLGEFVIAAILFFAKDLRRMLRNQEAARWEQFDVEEISRQTLSVVGYGEIGRAAGRRAKAMGMRVLAMRRRPASAPDADVDGWFSFEQRLEMIGQSDHVLVAAPLTTETRGLIGTAEIAAMKPTATIINVGRGPVIDEAALVDALRRRAIRGAALDVFDVEPLPENHPFWFLDNVLLSPHCADHTVDWLDQSVRFFVENFQRFARDQPLLNVVDKRAGY